MEIRSSVMDPPLSTGLQGKQVSRKPLGCVQTCGVANCRPTKLPKTVLCTPVHAGKPPRSYQKTVQTQPLPALKQPANITTPSSTAKTRRAQQKENGLFTPHHWLWTRQSSSKRHHTLFDRLVKSTAKSTQSRPVQEDEDCSNVRVRLEARLEEEAEPSSCVETCPPPPPASSSLNFHVFEEELAKIVWTPASAVDMEDRCLQPLAFTHQKWYFIPIDSR